MSEALVVGVVRQAIETAIVVSLPMLLAGLVAGVLVSIFQTVTSIQDNVLAFIPRAAAIFAVFIASFTDSSDGISTSRCPSVTSP